MKTPEEHEIEFDFERGNETYAIKTRWKSMFSSTRTISTVISRGNRRRIR